MSSGQGSAPGGERREQRGPRRLAEWLTFGVSAALVLLLGGHLSWRLREPAGDVAFAEVVLHVDGVQAQGERYVLPIELINPSRRTLRDVLIRVRRPGPGGARESIDVVVDYLGQSSSQTLYVYLHGDPRAGSVTAEAISYRVD